MNVSTAFLQIFGDALKPFGFQKLKNNQPYLVRVINGEILHVIACKNQDEYAKYPHDKAFNILAGTATVYRRKIDLNRSVSDNDDWLRCSIASFYSIPLGNHFNRQYCSEIVRFGYFSGAESSLIIAMNYALELTKKHILPVFNKINTLEACISFFKEFNLPFTTKIYDTSYDYTEGAPYNEGFLYLIVDDKEKKEELESIINHQKKATAYAYERAVEVYKYFTDPELRDRTLKTLQQNKKSNIELLTNQGIVF